MRMNPDKHPVTRRTSALYVALLAVSAAAALDATAQQRTSVPASVATDSRPLGIVVDEYVREGLAANLSLRAASLDVERSQAALTAARARFLPEAALEARYTRAEGGRQIEFPFAELLNPVYTSLNGLLAASGRPAGFPQLQDRGFGLIREREQDTRITLRQPLFTPAIPAAVRAQRAQLEGSEFARLALARRLRRDITVGYLGWLQASKAVGIVESSRGLLAENLRVNDSLFRNGKITQDQVLRARAELLAVDQQLRESANTRSQTQSYLNFLLNRALDAPFAVTEPDREIDTARDDLAELRTAALEGRPEVGQVERAVRAATAQGDIARSRLWPTLSLGVDGGIQGERYETGPGRNFTTISLLLNWTLFDGGARRAELSAARAAQRQLGVRREELASQIQLEVQQSLDSLAATADSLATAGARAEAARAGFRIASRKRDEGAINQVEFIDARNALTNAELNLNVTRFELLARQADLDYATAAGTLPAAIGVPSP